MYEDLAGTEGKESHFAICHTNQLAKWSPKIALPSYCNDLTLGSRKLSVSQTLVRKIGLSLCRAAVRGSGSQTTQFSDSGLR